MPRIDDYQKALELGRTELSGKNPEHISNFSGAELQRGKQGTVTFSLPFLGEEISISWPHLIFSAKRHKDGLPIEQQILLVHYLLGTWSSSGPGITADWCAFQDIPDGRFYLDTFLKRAKIPLVRSFGPEPERLVETAARTYGATNSDQGDVSVLIQALPLVPVALLIWKGDDEFPPEGNILFDKNISRIFSAEDIAWLAGMIVYPLISAASSLETGKPV